MPPLVGYIDNIQPNDMFSRQAKIYLSTDELEAGTVQLILSCGIFDDRTSSDNSVFLATLLGVRD